ncbi:xanthine dehydrogenase accessory protein XdhC [Paraburkholderia dokdonensis]|uniref:xanthine dehydrogenase accessory protein XdhC n=1 Tax=Paraburkholderia dokdonensis TaxID=2211211 RepID=UPI00101A344C|nr:xanthine dehydrogenase accessory protein XdhC [Paraburkholderia dokdonensis]
MTSGVNKSANHCERIDAAGRVVIGRRGTPVPHYGPMHVVLFGAGHVGHALVTLLGMLPCVVQWVDERDELFPDEVPANVQIEATDTPAAIVDEAPPGAYFIVMTHNHALDFDLSLRIMERGDFSWFGLIGSKTKRVKFERRLIDRGVAAERMSEMTCPIGVPGIVDKAPSSIAVAVAAQLMQMRAPHTAAGYAASAQRFARV